MQRVKDDQAWTLFCPNEAHDVETGKGLIDLWGEEFEALYTRLIDLWGEEFDLPMRRGVPSSESIKPMSSSSSN